MARHDAVAWGYARAADALGVDLLQQTEVTDLIVEQGTVKGVSTARYGDLYAERVGCVVAGNSGVLAKMAGFNLPLESHPLQALVSEPIKPILDTVVMSNHVHGYVSQSDKGDLVIGAGIDSYNGYGQRGSFPTIEHTLQAIVELFPIFSRVRMNRQWGGYCRYLPRCVSPLSARRPCKTCSSIVVGARGASRRLRARGMSLRHHLPRARCIRLPNRFRCSDFTRGRWSTNTAPPVSRIEELTMLHIHCPSLRRTPRRG